MSRARTMTCRFCPERAWLEASDEYDCGWSGIGCKFQDEEEEEDERYHRENSPCEDRPGPAEPEGEPSDVLPMAQRYFLF